MMKFVFVSSLESRALTSISSALWNSFSSRLLLGDFLSPNAEADYCNCRLNVRKNVEESVQNLILPKELKEKLARRADVMGCEILHWLIFHWDKCEVVSNVPEKFLWTPHGTINLQKTASILVCDSTIDVANRFKLACMYCLENHIFTLWNQLDEESRQVIDYLPSAISSLVKYWCDYVKATLDSSYEYRDACLCFSLGFTISLYLNMSTATNFFFSKLTKQQKNEFIGLHIIHRLSKEEYVPQPSFSYQQFTEIMCLLLSNVNEDQQIQVFSSYPSSSLRLFLNWPWQDFFIRVYQHVGHLLCEEEFFDLLDLILEEKSMCNWDYAYGEIFIHVWLEASTKYREYIYSFLDLFTSRFSYLCKHEDWHIFNLILRDATSEQRLQLLCSEPVCEVFASFIVVSNWNAIECFVAKCHLSNREIVTFKDKLDHLYNTPATAENFKIFCNLINSVVTANKKSCNENIESEPKTAYMAQF